MKILGKERSPFTIGIIATVFVWLLGVVVIYLLTRPSIPAPTGTTSGGTQPPAAAVARRAIDGMPLADGETEPRLYAVSIDNMVAARPHAGLSKASLVYEVPVESGITRFVAIYPETTQVAKIGPVRSARAYMVDILSQYVVPFLHVGGSPQALEMLKASSYVFDVDQFFYGPYFYRARNRAAPHNVYTSSDTVQGLLLKVVPAKASTSTLASWLYAPELPVAERTGHAGVVISYSTPTYEAEWRYNASENVYERYDGRVRHKDEDGTGITAKNVAVLMTEQKVLDEKGRLEVRVEGEGKAFVLREGVAIRGTWRQDGITSRVRFFDEAGKEISFIPGTTWVQVVGEASAVRITE